MSDGSGVEHGYYLTGPLGGSYTTIDYPPGNLPGTLAIRINNKGQIVGSYTSNGTTFHGYYLTGVGGSFTTIDPTILGSVFTEAVGLNDAGNIVGYFNDNNGFGHGYFLTGVGGTYSEIDYPGARNLRL